MHDLQIKKKNSMKDTEYYISVTILGTEKRMMKKKKVLTLTALILYKS